VNTGAGPRASPAARDPASRAGSTPLPHPAFTGPVFAAAGYRALYELRLPTLRGRVMRVHKVSGGVVLGFGLGVAVAGFAWAGPVGAAVGLAAGVGLGGSFVGRHRFCRR
jgi:hypothetical protein